MEIEGFPNYLIYPDGRVFGKKRKRFLKSRYDGGGYCIVNLSQDAKQKNKLVHRLVAQHYIPNPENKRCIDHINRVRNDNRVENLRWATYQENNQNCSLSKNNKSGHQYISYHKQWKGWRFQKMINGKTYTKSFKSKTDVLCFKYIMLLRQKANQL